MPTAHSSVASRRRRYRGWRRVFVLGALLPLALTAAAKCPPAAEPGFGLLVFGGDANSEALGNAGALGVNPLLTWAALEPSEGVYDWSPLDTVLEAAHAKGKRVAPRLLTNAGDYAHATPQWVFDAGAAAYAFDEGSTTPQPVPTDAVFRQKFNAFLAAFGARYDGQPDIEFIQTNAGMGGYGEMVWDTSPATRPPGWSPDVEIGTVEYWIDRWREAFPRTHLVLMENFIGYEIAERLTGYGVDRGFYLQANSPHQAPPSQAILARHAGRTKIVLEIENNGCRAATGPAFDELIGAVFSQGFPIDYLTMCGESFEDAARLQAAFDRLRKDPER